MKVCELQPTSYVASADIDGLKFSSIYISMKAELPLYLS